MAKDQSKTFFTRCDQLTHARVQRVIKRLKITQNEYILLAVKIKLKADENGNNADVAVTDDAGCTGQDKKIQTTGGDNSRHASRYVEEYLADVRSDSRRVDRHGTILDHLAKIQDVEIPGDG